MEVNDTTSFLGLFFYTIQYLLSVSFLCAHNLVIVEFPGVPFLVVVISEFAFFDEFGDVEMFQPVKVVLQCLCER